MPQEPIADLDAFRDAMRRAIYESGRKQARIAEAWGRAEGILSAWKNGWVKDFEPAEVFALEVAIGCHPGELSTHLGYLPLSAAGTVVADILADGDLGPGQRSILLELYRNLCREHARGADRPQDTSEEDDLPGQAPT